MKKRKKYKKSIESVIEFFGGIPRMAEALQIDRHTIYTWKKIPSLRAYQIQVLTNGKILASQLIE